MRAGVRSRPETRRRGRVIRMTPTKRRRDRASKQDLTDPLPARRLDSPRAERCTGAVPPPAPDSSVEERLKPGGEGEMARSSNPTILRSPRRGRRQLDRLRRPRRGGESHLRARARATPASRSCLLDRARGVLVGRNAEGRTRRRLPSLPPEGHHVDLLSRRSASPTTSLIAGLVDGWRVAEVAGQAPPGVAPPPDHRQAAGHGLDRPVPPVWRSTHGARRRPAAAPAPPAQARCGTGAGARPLIAAAAARAEADQIGVRTPADQELPLRPEPGPGRARSTRGLARVHVDPGRAEDGEAAGLPSDRRGALG